MTVINATLINLKKKEKKIEHSRPDACNYVDQNVIHLKHEYLSHF